MLRLDTVQPTLPASLDVVRTQGWQTVAVVDDSQIFASDMIEQLRELASERLKLIFGTTDPSGEKHGVVRAAAKTAVEALASHCRNNRQTLLPIVRRFDSHIGDGFLDERIESRIDHAAKEQTPWQFIYVLRGGNRKVREMLDAARDFAQADLLLVLIAVRQLATLDAGTPIADIMTASAKIGKGETWVRSVLGSLVRQRAILTSDVVRCLHLMSAGAIIEVSLGMRKGDEYTQIVTLVQDTLRHLSLPLRCISWLLHHIWPPHDDIIVGDEIKAELVARCVSAKSHLEIRDACFVMERLLGRRNKKALAQIMAHRDLLRSWVGGVDATDAYAIGGVINNIRYDSAKQATELRSNR